MKSIKIGRIRNDLTQQQLADKVGISKSSIKKYETGINQPTLETAKKIAKVLNITLDELVKE